MNIRIQEEEKAGHLRQDSPGLCRIPVCGFLSPENDQDDVDLDNDVDNDENYEYVGLYHIHLQVL